MLFKGGNNKSELQYELKGLFGLAVNFSHQKHLSPTSSTLFTLSLGFILL